MFTNKKDPLVDAVKSVMYEGNLKRQVEEAVNNHFGVSSRKAIPHEHLAEYDDLLSESYKQAIEEGNIKHPNQQKLDVHEPEKDKLTSKDFAMLRAGKKIEEKITKDMSAGDVISDFVHSKNPKFKDKSKKERQKMALGAYYSKHPEKSKKMDESIESIMEEIRVNLEEQLVAVYESGDEQMFEEFVSSLTEEQLEILGLNEIYSALGSLAVRAAATPIGQRAIGAAVGIGQKAVSAARSAYGTVSGSTAKAAQKTATTAQQTATTAQQSARTAPTNMSRMAAGTNAQQAAQRASSAQQAATTATRQTNIARGTLGTAALGTAASSLSKDSNDPGGSYDAPAPSSNDPGGSYDAPAPSSNDPGGSYDAPAPSSNDPGGSYDAGPAAKPAAKPAATPRTSTSAAIPVSKPKQQDDRPIAGFAPNVPSGQPGGSKWGNTFQESTHLKESLESVIRSRYLKG